MNDVVLCFQLHFTTREHCFGFCDLKAGEAHVPLLSEEGFDRLRMSAYLSVRFWRVNSLKCQLGLEGQKRLIFDTDEWCDFELTAIFFFAFTRTVST